MTGKHAGSKSLRILAIAPSSRGFGYAVIEGEEVLVDWGNMQAKGDKNANSLVKIERLLDLFSPDVLVLPDPAAKHTHRAPRVKALIEALRNRTQERSLRVALVTSEQVKKILLGHPDRTKHDVAAFLTKRFQPELGDLLPPKREVWMSEDRRVDIFEAVGLALAFLSMRMTARQKANTR